MLGVLSEGSASRRVRSHLLPEHRQLVVEYIQEALRPLFLAGKHIAGNEAGECDHLVGYPSL